MKTNVFTVEGSKRMSLLYGRCNLLLIILIFAYLLLHFNITMLFMGDRCH